MFGIKPKTGGLFGNMAPGMGAAGMAAPQMQPQAEPRKRGGLFGTGIKLTGDKLYALGGLLAGDGGAAIADYRQMQMAPAMEAAKREAEFADWERKEKWKRDNPSSINNDTANDYAFWQSKLSPEQFQTWVQNKVNPPQYRQGPDGNFYRVDTTSSQAPTAPVGKLTPISGGPQVAPAATFRP